MQPILYLAPLMGITNYIFRDTYSHFSKSFDAGVTPFLNKGNIKKVNTTLKRELLINKNLPMTPQILTNKAEDIIIQSEIISSFGHNEINWNLGCPYPRVVNKKRGSGLLPYIDDIRLLLDKAISKIQVKLSIKMRLGVDNTEPIFKLLEVFNDYPLKEIIIHPRTAKQMYSGKVDLDAFEKCLTVTKNEIIYSGDIFTVNDYKELKKKFPGVNKWMIGRGLLMNPLLPEKIKEGDEAELTKSDFERIKVFHDSLLENYKEVLSGEAHLLHKMKELMSFLINIFDDSGNTIKKIQKSKTLSEYKSHVNHLFNSVI